MGLHVRDTRVRKVLMECVMQVVGTLGRNNRDLSTFVPTVSSNWGCQVSTTCRVVVCWLVPTRPR